MRNKHDRASPQAILLRASAHARRLVLEADAAGSIELRSRCQYRTAQVPLPILRSTRASGEYVGPRITVLQARFCVAASCDAAATETTLDCSCQNPSWAVVRLRSCNPYRVPF